jgi:undecaprenyl-phosphate 4-deoxy-4-formamido-L-arabinose transferase
VYCGAETIVELVKQLAAVLPGVAPALKVILVNDGSPDTSWETITRLVETYPWVRGINLMRNYGQHNATLCGIRAAQYEVIITMDDDLQHPPDQIPLLLAELQEGRDVVYGIPRKLPHSWWRNMFSWVIKRLMAYVIGIPQLRDFSAFRAFRTSVRRAFQDYQNPNVIVDVLLSWGTTRFSTVRIDESPRAAGRSGYNFSRLFQYALVVLTAYSTAPLRFASTLGFLFTFFGLAVFIYVLGIYFLAGSIPGFPFLASIISLFSGTQLFALGIIGEYLGRIFDRSMDRPPYVVGEESKQN